MKERTLVTGNQGMSPTKNPSERNDGWVRYKYLVNELPALRKTCSILAGVLTEGVEAQSVLNALAEGSMKTFSGDKNYKNVRMIRMLMMAAYTGFADTEADWTIWSGMSPSLKHKLRAIGLMEYGEAVRARDAVRVLKKDDAYSLADLAMLVCLADV